MKLYNIVLVLPNIEMNLPQVYLCSPSCTLLPPPSPDHPSGSSQCTSPKHPVSFIEPGLVTRFLYDIIHVSMPFSQFIPPSPSQKGKHQYSILTHIYMDNNPVYETAKETLICTTAFWHLELQRKSIV